MTISSHEQVALLTDYDAQSAYSIAYQQLYASIRLNWNSEQGHTQTVLLVAPTEAASQATAAANVAIAAAQSGTPTLLVDANLRHPSLQQRFGLGDSAGLSELLASQSLSTQHIKACLKQTFVPGLSLLSAGKTSSDSNLLIATRLHTVVDCLRQYFADTAEQPTLIVFHTEPVLHRADAAFISTLVDQTFLLIAAGRTKRAQARRAHEQLQQAHAKLTGAILLDV